MLFRCNKKLIECYDCGLQAGNDTCGDFAEAGKQTCQRSGYCATLTRAKDVDVIRGCDMSDGDIIAKYL